MFEEKSPPIKFEPFLKATIAQWDQIVAAAKVKPGDSNSQQLIIAIEDLMQDFRRLSVLLDSATDIISKTDEIAGLLNSIAGKLHRTITVSIDIDDHKAEAAIPIINPLITDEPSFKIAVLMHGFSKQLANTSAIKFDSNIVTMALWKSSIKSKFDVAFSQIQEVLKPIIRPLEQAFAANKALESAKFNQKRLVAAQNLVRFESAFKRLQSEIDSITDNITLGLTHFRETTVNHDSCFSLLFLAVQRINEIAGLELEVLMHFKSSSHYPPESAQQASLLNDALTMAIHHIDQMLQLIISQIDQLKDSTEADLIPKYIEKIQTLVTSLQDHEWTIFPAAQIRAATLNELLQALQTKLDQTPLIIEHKSTYADLLTGDLQPVASTGTTQVTAAAVDPTVVANQQAFVKLQELLSRVSDVMEEPGYETLCENALSNLSDAGLAPSQQLPRYLHAMQAMVEVAKIKGKDPQPLIDKITQIGVSEHKDESAASSVAAIFRNYLSSESGQSDPQTAQQAREVLINLSFLQHDWRCDTSSSNPTLVQFEGDAAAKNAAIVEIVEQIPMGLRTGSFAEACHQAQQIIYPKPVSSPEAPAEEPKPL